MRKFKRYLLTVDEDLNVIKCDKAFLSYLNLPELMNLGQIIPPSDLLQLRNCLFGTDYGSNNLACFRVKTSKNTLDWIAANIEKPHNFNEPIHMELSDIQAMKNDSTNSLYDKMTGLFNKNAITELANELMQTSGTKPFYFFLMDIDNFKTVNDTFGHMRGDEVITDVAHIARDFVGEDGIVGRIGGDEFMLVLENISTEPELRKTLFNIRDTVEKKYSDMGQNVSITVSMGGALYPTDAMDYDSMFMLADKMLYLAKTKGRNRYIIYTPLVHGKVMYDGKVMTISHQMMMNREKSSLMLELMDKFLIEKTLPFYEAFEKIISNYMLDGLFVIEKNKKKSTYGIAYSGSSEATCTPCELELPEGIDKELDSRFDNGPITLIGFELDKEIYPILSNFLKQNNYRVVVAYNLKNVPRPGYIFYINLINSNCRFSQTDLMDLTYFSHMVELVGCDALYSDDNQ